MMRRPLEAVLFLLCCSFTSYGQSNDLLIFPKANNWNVLSEGDTLTFQLKTNSNDDYIYSMHGAADYGMQLDTIGGFSWVPDYSLVNRVQEQKTISVIFEATNLKGDKVRKEIEFVVNHKNRIPSIDELPVFYVRQYTLNEFNLNKLDQIKDLDDDPIVFKPVLSQMPEGARLSELGVLSWKPSRSQFRALVKKPLTVQFIVQDQPEKTEAIGILRIAPTQMDLPPEILVVPNDTLLRLREDEVLNLKFYVSDPNGDDNIKDVDFVANDLRISKTSLTRNTNTQWELTWSPGYDFVGEEEKEKEVDFLFYVLDESNKRSEKELAVVVEDTENLEQKDARLFSKYRNTLLSTMDLINHLDYNQKTLNKMLKKAKKGKKKRAIVNASLGAITGISPVIIESEDKDIVTGVGGTAVLTLSTLEATEVLGRSKDDILERLKINIDIRNQLQSEGDGFARQFALKSDRRNDDFFVEVDKMKKQLNNQKLILLELDAGWENSNKPTDNNIRKQFPDFNNEGFQ